MYGDYFTKITKIDVKEHFKAKNTNIKNSDTLSQETIQPSTTKMLYNKPVLLLAYTFLIGLQQNTANYCVDSDSINFYV